MHSFSSGYPTQAFSHLHSSNISLVTVKHVPLNDFATNLRCVSALCLCGVVGSGADGDCDWLRQHAFWVCAIPQAVRTEVQRRLGGLCFSSGTCVWLTHLLLSVRQSGGFRCWLLSGKWSRVGNACGLWFIRLLGRGRLCSRPFIELPLLSGLPCMILPSMIGQSQRRARMKSALITPSCLFASRFFCVRAWRLCLPFKHRRGAFPVLCLAGVVLHCQWTFIWFRYVWLRCAFCFALPCSFCTPDVVVGVDILPSMSQLV
jgi:hypothetical protein